MLETDTTITNLNVNNLSLAKAAIHYSSLSRVFPLAPNSKIPLLPGDWSEYATNDIIQVIHWWSQNPNANIALVMDTNFTTIDLDMKDGKDGFKSFNDLKSTKSSIYQDTPTSGIHLIYRHPQHQSQPFHNATNKGSNGGIDVRSGNAYIVVAPSVVNNVHYKLHGDLHDAPPLPQSLIDTLTDWYSPVVMIGVPQPPLVTGEARSRLISMANNLAGKPMEFYHAGIATHYNGDRSAALMGLATLLYSNNLSDAEVLTLLATSMHCMSVAFDRKRGDYQGQIAWLWKYTCQKARANAPSNLIEQVFDVEDEPTQPTAQPAHPTNPPKPNRTSSPNCYVM